MAEVSQACLSCKAPLSEDLVVIGDQLPSAIYPRASSDHSKLTPSSLNLARCENPDCTLIQLSKISSLKEVFESYPYESASTANMKDILKDLVEEASLVANLFDQDNILDIGGNDGTMLSLFETYSHRVNIDVAHGVSSVINTSKDIKVNDYFSAKAWKSLNLASPKLITSVAMFYHLEDPQKFCKEVVEIMDQDSVFCVQMTYAGSMLDNLIYDNIVHEHRAYYSLHSLQHCFRKVGLHIKGAKVVDSYGGSLRVYASLNSNFEVPEDLSSQMKEIETYELRSGLNHRDSLVAFNKRIQEVKNQTLEMIGKKVKEYGPIVALGASTKGNMILQFLGLGPDQVEAVYDNNQKKIGTTLVGSGIPIKDEKEITQAQSRTILILPYYYTEFFSVLLRDRLLKSPQDYELIIPLPEPKCIRLEGAYEQTG